MKFLRAGELTKKFGFSWRGTAWSIALAIALYGLYFLAQRRIIGDTGLVLIIALSVPLAIVLIGSSNRG